MRLSIWKVGVKVKFWKVIMKFGLGVRIMKNVILASVLAFGLFAMNASAIFAAPYNAANNNPQVVAAYLDPTTTHGIPSEPGCNHIGIDLVKQNGNSGNFQEWSYGTQPCNNELLHGDHDLWQISKDGTCPANATVVPNAYPGWGSYLVPGVTYCVINNDFHVSK
jgi:hypothetical protein